MTNTYKLNDFSKEKIAKDIGLEREAIDALCAEILSFFVMNKKKVKIFFDEKKDVKIRYKRKIFNQDELSRYLYNISYASNPKLHLCPDYY